MSEKLRFAMVGAGWWAHSAHLPALVEDNTIDLVAVCDPNADRAQLAADQYGPAAAFTDIGEMLATANVEAAVVATPHTTHRVIVEQLLRSGVDVLVEKPMTTSAQDAWAIVELARKLGRTLSVGLTYQYGRTAQRVRDIVRQEIGELVAVNAEFSSGTFGLFGGLSADFMNDDDPRAPHGATYADPALSGGGQGHTQLSHLMGSMFYSVGKQALDVFAYMDNRGLNVDIVNALTFRLDGGTLGAATSAGTTPSGSRVRNLIRYHGTLAVVEHDLLKGEAWMYEGAGVIRLLELPDHVPAYDRRAPVHRFAELLRGETANAGPADLAAASVSLVEAAYISAAEYRPVDVQRGTLDED